MPISFHPRAGRMFMCDFSGFQPPEMVKVRPVVVISPKLPFRSVIVTIRWNRTTSPAGQNATWS